MTEEEHNNQENNNNLKIIITAIFSVMFGAVFILALINFGAGMQRTLDIREEKRKKDSEIVSILGVDYESVGFSYVVPASVTPKEESEKQPKNYLFHNASVEDEDADYTVITSKDQLDNMLSAIQSASGDTKGFAVEDDFFQTSSIVVVNVEESGLSDLKVKAIARDEKYNLQIDLTKDTGMSDLADAIDGRVVFVKIKNIQPSLVDVNIK